MHGLRRLQRPAGGSVAAARLATTRKEWSWAAAEGKTADSLGAFFCRHLSTIKDMAAVERVTLFQAVPDAGASGARSVGGR